MTRLTPPQLGELVVLEAGSAQLEFAPGCGARILSFDIDQQPILRPASARAREVRAPYDFAGFPLMPYSGPLFRGGFQFGGESYQLGRNVTAEPDATHGDAWINSWRVESRTRERAKLRFDYAPVADTYPFAWSGEIIYALRPNSLSIDMTIRNSDTRPMPAGMGFHPYFPRPDATHLTFAHGFVWPPDSADAVKQTPTAIEGLDFSSGRDLTGLVADRCFEDWPGVAHLDYPDGRRTTIAATPEFGKLQLYSPWYDPFVCVEPVTNANDGFNRALLGIEGHGVVTLRPGEALSGSIRISTGSWNV